MSIAATALGPLEVIEPGTGQVLTELEPDDLDGFADRVETARRAQDIWALTPVDERAKVLWRIATLIEERIDELSTLESRNGGKPIAAAAAEVGLAARTFRYYAGAVDKQFGQTLGGDATALHYTLRQPIGVVGAIVPWNFPIVLAAWKIAPALACGNSILVKPAAMTPLSAIELAELCREAGVPDGCVQVLLGSGSTVGRALVDHPLVRKISFTGSTATGHEIMVRAARNFKRLTLELGGKSANLIFADADLDRACEQAVASCFDNAGQDCCARTRILVQRDVYDEAVTRLVDRTSRINVGDPLLPETEMGALISGSQLERAAGYVERGTAEGASLLCGGSRLPGPGFFLTPALLADAQPDSALMRDEIFGPVGVVHAFDDEDEAVRLANDSDYGLSGSVWTADAGRAARVARRLDTGVVSVNTSLSVHVTAPFGGVKASGIGRELGTAALDAYTETKSVYQDIGAR